MLPISSTESPALEFGAQKGSQKMRIPTSKIGWLHSIADKKGISFDIEIKDASGRLRFKRLNCKSDNEQFGELINMPTHLGEELEVCVENLKGADSLKVFLN